MENGPEGPTLQKAMHSLVVWEDFMCLQWFEYEIFIMQLEASYRLRKVYVRNFVFVWGLRWLLKAGGGGGIYCHITEPPLCTHLIEYVGQRQGKQRKEQIGEELYCTHRNRKYNPSFILYEKLPDCCWKEQKAWDTFPTDDLKSSAFLSQSFWFRKWNVGN